MAEVIAPWLVSYNALGIVSPIADEANFAAMAIFAESLADSWLDDASDLHWGWVSLLAEGIRAYEKCVYPPVRPCTPCTVAGADDRAWTEPERSARSRSAVDDL